jgi:hypothetical protein
MGESITYFFSITWQGWVSSGAHGFGSALINFNWTFLPKELSEGTLKSGEYWRETTFSFFFPL